MTVRTALAVILLGLAAPAMACDRPAQTAAMAAPVPERGIDHALLDRAVLAEINVARCRAGLGPLQVGPSSLRDEAVGHSEWMARTGRLSHQSTRPGRADLRDRLAAAEVRPATASENVAFLNRYRFGTSEFRVIDEGACAFTDRAGREIGPHSYASLAREAVGIWMESPGHRRNILDPDARYVTTAAAFGEARYCGRLWLTQVFLGQLL